MITLGVSVGIIGIIIGSLLIYHGIEYCRKNNAMGVVLLFISLNVLGIIIGGAILGNNKYLINNEKENKKEIVIYNTLDDEQKKSLCNLS